MDLNSTQAITRSRSVFHCPQLPFFTWDLNNTTFSWILVVIKSISSPVTILLNSLVITAVKKRKELQKHSNILLSSLAVADLLVGAITMPLSAAVDILILRQVSFEHICTLDSVVNKNVIIFLSSSTLYHLTVIAWERYMAIQKWMDYKVIVTKGLLKKLALAAWFLTVFTKVPAFGMIVAGVDRQFIKISRIGERVVVVGCLVAVAYFYVMVYIGVRKRKISEISNITVMMKAKMQSKLGKTTALLTAALIFSFVPAIAIALLAKISPVFGTNSAFRLTEALVQLNSLVSPILYCYRDRRFRKAVLELLGIGKPEPIQPAVAAARFVRRKDPFGSVELQSVQKQRFATRSASCDPAVGLDCVYPLAKPHKILLKRSMSAPKLNKCSGSLVGSQLHQPSSILITSATIHAESAAPLRAKKTNRVWSVDAISAQGGLSHPTRKIQRSKSLDRSVSVILGNSCQNVPEKTVRRPESAPSTIIVPDKACNE